MSFYKRKRKKSAAAAVVVAAVKQASNERKILYKSMRQIDFVYIISRFLHWNLIINFGIIHHSANQKKLFFFVLSLTSSFSTCFAHPCILVVVFFFRVSVLFDELSVSYVCVLFIILIRIIFFPFGNFWNLFISNSLFLFYGNFISFVIVFF